METQQSNTIKQANTAYPIHPLLSQRWSPRAFTTTTLDAQAIGSLFEAARWSASAANGQPWSFLIATQEQSELFERLLACLNDSNAVWANRAALLGIAIAKTMRDDGRPAPTALYDLGLSMQNLVVQATAMGLYVHQMGGFSADKARSQFQIPETHQPVAAFAVGVLGDPAILDEKNRTNETSARVRKPISEFVFGDAWGVKSDLV